MDPDTDALIDAALRGDADAGKVAARELVTRARAGSPDVWAALHRRLAFGGGSVPLAALLGQLAGKEAPAAVIDPLVLMMRDRDAKTREAAAAALVEAVGTHANAARLAGWLAEPQGWPAASRQRAWALLADRWAWPGNEADVRLLAAMAAQDADPSSTPRHLLSRTLRGETFAAAAVDTLAAQPFGGEILRRIVVEIGGAAGEAARDALLRLAGVPQADSARWVEALELPRELRNLGAKDAETRREAATRLGAFRASAAREALERALRDAVPAVREAAARALASLGSTASRGALQAAVRQAAGPSLTTGAIPALSAALDALAVVGDLDSLAFLLTLSDENSTRHAQGTVALLARRLGGSAAALARDKLGRTPTPPLALHALGAAAGADAVPVLESFVAKEGKNALAGLGATRAAAAVPALLAVVKATTYSGFAAADILSAASGALAEILAHDATRVPDHDLAAVAELADTVVMAGARGMSTRLPVNFMDAREHANAELARRGLPQPPARGMRPLPMSTAPAPEPAMEARPARLARVGQCPDCGQPLTCTARWPGAYAVSCPADHRRELRAEYARLAIETPAPDISLATHFARCTGAAWPLAPAAAYEPLALERRDGAWVETQAGTSEADRPYPELERGELAAAPWRVRPERHGMFLAGFAATGRTTVFRVLDIAADRMIFLSTPFGGVDAQPADLARQSPEVVRLGRVHAALVASLGNGVASLHAIHDRGRGYCGLALPDGRVIHHEGPLLMDDVRELWTPRLLPARCPRCQGDAPAKKVPTAIAYVSAPIEVTYACAACRQTFNAPWPPKTPPSARPAR